MRTKKNQNLNIFAKQRSFAILSTQLFSESLVCLSIMYIFYICVYVYLIFYQALHYLLK